MQINEFVEILIRLPAVVFGSSFLPVPGVLTRGRAKLNKSPDAPVNGWENIQQGASRLETGALLVHLLDFLGWWPGKPGFVDRNVVLYLVNLDRRTARWTGNGDSERQSNAVDISIIRIIDLLRIDAKCGLFVAHDPHQQA